MEIFLQEEVLIQVSSSSSSSTESSGAAAVNDPAAPPAEAPPRALLRFPSRNLPARRRSENDAEYQYLKMYESAKVLLQDIFKTPHTINSEHILERLQRQDYEGWSLDWERKLTVLGTRRSYASDVLQHAFQEVIPVGVSESLYHLVACPTVNLMKRKKLETDETRKDGKAVFEVANINDCVFLRVVQTSKRRRFSGNKVFTGRDRRGKEIFKLVWGRALLSRRRLVKVYCPVGCHVGTLRTRWSMREHSYYSVISPTNERFARIKGRLANVWFDADLELSDVTGNMNFYNMGESGAIRGDWAWNANEPVMSITFPLYPIGLLTKLMTLAASILIFERAFKSKLKGKLLPQSENTSQEMQTELRRVKRKRHLAIVNDTSSEVAKLLAGLR